MEDKEITGLSIDEDITKYIITDIESSKIFFSILLRECLINNINLGLLVSTKYLFSFVVNSYENKKIDTILENILNETSFETEIISDLTKLTLVGLGFTSSTSLSLSLLSLLVDNDISINQTAATNLVYTILINDAQSNLVIKLVSDKYKI